MPKVKTHRGAAKRFKVSARGKVRHRQANLRHLLCGKRRKRKRRLKKLKNLEGKDRRLAKILLATSF